LLMKRDEGGQIRPSRKELEGGTFDDLATELADGTITRARAIKLAGAALFGGALTLLWPGEADARKRRRRRKNRRERRPRRRRARVTNPQPVTVTPGNNTVNVKNPGSRALTIEKVHVLDGDGDVIAVKRPLGGPVTIKPGKTLPVTVNLDANDLLDADKLRLIDARGVPVTVIDDNGEVVGDIDIRRVL
jgi:hypothetical protein